jgi:tyrocidine synthetase-3
LSAERFIADPYVVGERMYRSGDRGRWLADGRLEYLGRRDEQVQIRGFRIELGEIQSRLMEHSLLAKVEVIAHQIQNESPELVAYVVPTAEVTVTELRSYLSHLLPHYMVPSAFIMLDNLPLTANGKVDRRALPLPDPNRQGLRPEYVAPRTFVEELLCDIWREVLGIERVGVRDNFFDLGGHSLRATQVVSRIREAFALEVPLQKLFESPCVADLAVALLSLDAELDAGELEIEKEMQTVSL